VRSLLNQDFVIRNAPVDPALNLPYIDITDIDPAAETIDFSQGFGARNIEGASIAVRALWNPATFVLVSDPATNIRRLEEWQRNWRRSTVETYLTRGDARS
jgi:hypothetical protein